jgi:GMP synthase (glutamine-hydrolysing)
MDKIRESIAIIDFGSQYGQLIARRIREHKVYSQIFQPSVRAEALSDLKVKGIILSGGPASVNALGAPTCDPALFDLGVPILGICYGMQVGCKILGAAVSSA